MGGGDHGMPGARAATMVAVCGADDEIHLFDELRRGGMSRRAIARHVSEGHLIRAARGLYADRRVCAPRRTAAAHGGALACVSAARHLGLWVLSPDDELHVGVGGHRHPRVHDGCRCVTHWDDGPGAAFAPVSVPRVLRQVLRCRGVEEFFVVLESALRTGQITRAGVAWLRATGGPAAREAIAYARDDADSGLESLVRWRLRDRGLRLRTQMSIVSVGRVDILIGERLLVEVDGVENHDGTSHRHKDLVRDAHAVIWGYVTLRFDYAMVVHDWETVEAAILAAVDRGLHRTD
ncbi:DUF559 domain-containing protein [Microbacterium koreense]|uniref:DUF559 domain-containing protein n=1 Tax=Microbacterium koreense TaxID=323761 RepID=A0ABW2ZPV2_9MICO